MLVSNGLFRMKVPGLRLKFANTTRARELLSFAETLVTYAVSCELGEQFVSNILHYTTLTGCLSVCISAQGSLNMDYLHKF